MKKIINSLFFMLSFYCFGASVLGSFALYHSWLFVGEAEFSIVHKEAGQRIVIFFVLPFLILTVITILMFWYRHTLIPKRQLWLAFSCLMVSWVSSALIQIPIQLQLDHGKDVELLNKLITTDWIRIIASLIYISIVIQMTSRLQSALDRLLSTAHR